MHRTRLLGSIIAVGVVIVIAMAIALTATQPAEAQCGSQASSCKNCHETQAKDPVNNDGTGWHQSHAFGDFCYICHGGNSQATDEVAAHTGMVAPLADIQAACGQCHPNDLQARAEVYAVKLGAPLGAGATPSPQSAATAAPTASAAAPAAQGAPPPAADAAGTDNLTDYVARYNQNVLHQQPFNWGNTILTGLILLLVVGGALFINSREHWISISFTERKSLDKDLPADVAALASQAARLDPTARKSLSHLLEKPAATAQLLSALDRLTTDKASGDKT